MSALLDYIDLHTAGDVNEAVVNGLHAVKPLVIVSFPLNICCKMSAFSTSHVAFLCLNPQLHTDI